MREYPRACFGTMHCLISLAHFISSLTPVFLLFLSISAAAKRGYPNSRIDVHPYWSLKKTSDVRQDCLRNIYERHGECDTLLNVPAQNGIVLSVHNHEAEGKACVR